jgi:hypothetical protein
VATGKVITDIRPRHTSADFVAFLNKINRNVPTDLDVHVIVDEPPWRWWRLGGLVFEPAG